MIKYLTGIKHTKFQGLKSLNELVRGRLGPFATDATVNRNGYKMATFDLESQRQRLNDALTY